MWRPYTCFALDLSAHCIPVSVFSLLSQSVAGIFSNDLHLFVCIRGGGGGGGGGGGSCDTFNSSKRKPRENVRTTVTKLC